MRTRIVGGEVITASGSHSGDISLAKQHVEPLPSEAAWVDTLIDATDLWVGPGFIDLQINGGFGIDLSSSPEGLWDLGRRLARHGVTSFLPTIVTSPPATTQSAIAAFADRPASYLGAEPLGLHFEGPMLSLDRLGAHRSQHLSAPHLNVIDGWSRDVGVAMVTLAPELPNALSIVSELRQRGVVVSAGHTNATSAQARAGVDAGISMVTHLFNAMAPLGHRNPNLVGVVLADTPLVAGLIVDGIHVDPIAVKAAWNSKGPSGIALVTDAVAAMGEPSGVYQLTGGPITADETGVRNRDGTLAGSALTMDRAIANLVAFTQCDVHQAVASASSTPAVVLGERGRGHLDPGAVADVVLFDDNYDVQITICAGTITYLNERASGRVEHRPKKAT